MVRCFGIHLIMLTRIAHPRGSTTPQWGIFPIEMSGVIKSAQFGGGLRV